MSLDDVFQILGCVKCRRKDNTLIRYEHVETHTSGGRRYIKTTTLTSKRPIPVCSKCRLKFNKWISLNDKLNLFTCLGMPIFLLGIVLSFIFPGGDFNILLIILGSTLMVFWILSKVVMSTLDSNPSNYLKIKLSKGRDLVKPGRTTKWITYKDWLSSTIASLPVGQQQSFLEKAIEQQLIPQSVRREQIRRQDVKERAIYAKESKKPEQLKLLKKAYPYICDKCKELAHTEHEYCEKCGEKDSVRKANKEDYLLHIDES